MSLVKLTFRLMCSRLTVSVAVVTISLMIPAVGQAQSSCLSGTGPGLGVREWLIELATRTGLYYDKEREALQIPLLTDSSQVRFVTDKRICDKVLLTFKTGGPGWPTPLTSLYVLRIGTSTYAGAVYEALPPPPPGGIRTGVATYVTFMDSRYRFIQAVSY